MCIFDFSSCQGIALFVSIVCVSRNPSTDIEWLILVLLTTCATCFESGRFDVCVVGFF